MNGTNGRSSKKLAALAGGVMNLERSVPGFAPLYGLLNGPGGELRFVKLRKYTVGDFTSLAAAVVNDAPDKPRPSIQPIRRKRSG